jgi:predicted RNA-binding protein YlxR (DUF448 family)
MGCGRREKQRELLRLQAAADGRVVVLTAGGTPLGRSGYLHRRQECWQQFASRKGRVRSLGRNVERAQRLEWLRELERTELAAKMMR